MSGAIKPTKLNYVIFVKDDLRWINYSHCTHENNEIKVTQFLRGSNCVKKSYDMGRP
jgi:hypothetical protein